ncbi:MAG: DNA methyltransferase [Pseudomonadota bacterium]
MSASSISLLDGRVTLHHGDVLEAMKALPDASVHAVATDPPYHLTSIQKRFAKPGQKSAKSGKGASATGAYARASAGFMGKNWDGGDIAFRPDVWRECFRVLKPGGYILAFASTRGFGHMQVAIEEAGFITHPMILWVFGSGFPKAHNAARAIDKTLGQQGDVVPSGDPVKRIRPGADQHKDGSWEKLDDRAYQPGEYMPGSDEAAAWAGHHYGGQALKPACEPIYMGQKPFAEKNGALNLIAHGAGALNIDGCRVGTEALPSQKAGDARIGTFERSDMVTPERLGRWPANLIHDGSDEVLAAFPSDLKSGTGAVKRASSAQANGNAGAAYGAESREAGTPMISHGDSGSAARFFYSAKADADDRIGSKHPTVKPVDLMRYLVRLVTPKGPAGQRGTVLDPFAGTGTTGEAAFCEGFNAILIEREDEYVADIKARMALCLAGPDERKREIAKRRDESADAGPLFESPSVERSDLGPEQDPEKNVGVA